VETPEPQTGKDTASKKRKRPEKDTESPEKEAASGDSSERQWRLSCSTIADWEALPLQFEGSRNQNEKALFKILQEQIVPQVLEVLQEKQREKEKEAQQLYRKRSTRLLGLELGQIELIESAPDGRRSLRKSREQQVRFTSINTFYTRPN
jgi:hypothetical protein